MANHPIPPDRLQEYLDKARPIQARLGTLNVRECMEAWGYNSTSATTYALQVMADAGLVVKIQRGAKSIYRIQEEE